MNELVVDMIVFCLCGFTCFMVGWEHGPDLVTEIHQRNTVYLVFLSTSGKDSQEYW